MEQVLSEGIHFFCSCLMLVIFCDYVRRSEIMNIKDYVGHRFSPHCGGSVVFSPVVGKNIMRNS